MIILTDLWRYHPAALYAFSVLLGSSFALFAIGPYFFSFSLVLLIFPLFTSNYQAFHGRFILALILGITSFYFASIRYHFPEDNAVKTGIANIEINALKLSKTPFGLMWNYKGTLKSFIQNGEIIAKEIPVVLSMPFDKKNSRPAADFQYQIPSRLKTTAHGKYVITPIKNKPWRQKSKQSNLVEWRYSAKSALHNYIQKSFKDSHIGAFLSGMATGEFDDRLLSFELSRFGLQHLMAISGLHFSIISTLMALTLGIFFSRNLAALTTIGLMSAYFLFLGPSASVARAWLALIIGLTSPLIQRRSFAFNALGITALIVILWNPLIMEEIGFQFSFGITAAILLWFSSCDAFLQKLFAKRPLSQVINMDYWDQHGYCLLYFLRQSLALCLAVNLVAMPLTLYHFHTFPLISLLYNLFFPFLVSISLILLVVACTLSLFFPWLANLLHSLNEAYTQFVLNFAFNLPKSFDITWKLKEIPKEALLIYLLAIFIVGMFLHKRSQKKQNSGYPVTFA